MDLFDTIAAISTPAGRGGISIIRVSGKDAISICDEVFENPKGKKLENAASHTIHYGFIKDKNGEIIDEVLVSVMRAPKTYTAEDVVEINCHGGMISAGKILGEVLKCGARSASAGEFTKRAFLNGRMDLAEAESVIDIINSKTNLYHSVSVNQLEGHLSGEINKMREKLLSLFSHLQVLLDFPEEDLEPLSDSEFLDVLKDCRNDVQKLLSTAQKGSIIREGIQTAIVGKPNVGKSSLLNLLSGHERAIVTDIEGTTRDVIEEYITLGNVFLKIIDTAGIRKTSDVIESIGVEKSISLIESSNLILFVLDATYTLDDNDLEIAKSLKGKSVIALVNKSENENRVDMEFLNKNFDHVILFSVKEKKGVDKLEQTISRMFEMDEIDTLNRALITNIRHKESLDRCLVSLESAISAIDAGISPDVTFVDIQNAIESLGEITGVTVGQEIVDRIFHSFCVGK